MEHPNKREALFHREIYLQESFSLRVSFGSLKGSITCLSCFTLVQHSDYES